MTKANGEIKPRGKRGRTSTIDKHPQRIQIELAIANDLSCTKIGERFGVHRDAVWRPGQKMTPQRRAMLKYNVGELRRPSTTKRRAN